MRIKVVLAITAAVIMFVSGFVAGFTVCNRAPKWIEETPGAQVIITECFGQLFEAFADKPAHHYNELAFIVSCR